MNFVAALVWLISALFIVPAIVATALLIALRRSVPEDRSIVVCGTGVFVSGYLLSAAAAMTLLRLFIGN